MKKRNLNKILIYYTFNLLFVISLLFIVVLSNQKEEIIINNINTVKSTISNRVVFTSNSNKIVNITSINDVLNNKDKIINFTGTLTGYGADCVGCSGIVGCPPHQDVRNNNIYYNDSTYGNIRILAADPSIPCGSIIEISNYKFLESPFYGIVLDRGSAIKGLTMDLLYENENETVKIGRQYNIDFKIERWGF